MRNRFCYIVLLISSLLQVTLAGNSLAAAGKSLFSSGRWVKIETSASGIHKIAYSWLKSVGFAHPENVRIFGSRNEAMSRSISTAEENFPVQLPVLRRKESAGNEVIIFYVQGDVKWSYNQVTGKYHYLRNQAARKKSYFFLTEDTGSEFALPTYVSPAGIPEMQISSYDDCLLWGEENINLLESGQRWFTSMMMGGNILNKSFQIQDRIENSVVNLTVHAAGKSLSTTGMEVSVNGISTGTVRFKPVQPSGEADFAVEDSLDGSGLYSGQSLQLALKYNGGSTDQCWFDDALLSFRRNLQYRGAPLLFRDSKSVDKAKVIEYQIGGATSTLQLWEVTNPMLPVQINYSYVNGIITFRSDADQLRSFLLFDPQSQYPGVNKTEEVEADDLLQTVAPQYLIITPVEFHEQAERLAQYHRTTDQLTVAVVNVEAIFNEFSGGYRDASAIRNYVRLLLHQKEAAGPVLKYLLLFGKGTCDPVHEAGENNPDWIPAVQSENSLNPVNSYASDDFYGWSSENGNPNYNLEIGIGRIPAATKAEAATAVDKIVHYHDASTLGEWRNNLLFIGDDEDGNLHVNDSEKLATMVNRSSPAYKTAKIYLDAFPQVLTPEERYPEVTEAIRRSVHAGDLIVNYVGHASEDGLAHERVLTIKEIDAWTNKSRLPLFVTATCEFSRWDMTVKRSAGEHLYFNANGGAIALFSATRLVYASSNFEINKSFFAHLFDKDLQGSPIRLGDLIRIVKNENGGTINTSKFCLLGDPALLLNYPEYHCENLQINGKPVSQFSGTVSPTMQVTVTGEIQDNSGKKMDLFNGSLSAVVYDQPTLKQTLGNGGLTQFSYLVEESILFNGSVQVKSGSFAYTFVVPKDVNFNNQAGMIRYYFSNGASDGNGAFANLHFNGKDISVSTDAKGPEIRLFLENEAFREGGTVSANPLLIAYLKDDSGINTSGIGIGHDLTIELDGKTNERLILNDYYKADPGTWKSGVVTYPYSSLSTGSHTMTFKAWDTANNSSSMTINFYVNNDLVINKIYNFPNPFKDQTRFVVVHNRFDELFNVNLEILDLSGKRIYQNSQLLPSHGYEINDLIYHPLLGDNLPSAGLYIYRISIENQDGSKASASGRLVWRK